MTPLFGRKVLDIHKDETYTFLQFGSGAQITGESCDTAIVMDDDGTVHVTHADNIQFVDPEPASNKP